MEKLFMMEFPSDDIRLDIRYRNEELLEGMKGKTAAAVTPAKIADVYDEMPFPQPPEERPYIVSSIVLSSDGKMAFEDISEGPAIAKQNFLDPGGALADFWMLNAIRTFADAVVIGARTLQNEPKNTSHIFDPVLLEQRKETLGKGAHPVNIVASFDASDIPLDHLIFNIDPEEGLPVAIYTSPDGGAYLEKHFKKRYRLYGPYADAESVRMARQSEGDGFLRQLRDDLEPGSGVIPVIMSGSGKRPEAGAFLAVLRSLEMEMLVAESPSFTAHLMENEMLDEFFINYSMVYAGGTFTPGKASPFSHDGHPHAQLLTLATHTSSFMYTRQRLFYGVSSSEDLSGYKY